MLNFQFPDATLRRFTNSLYMSCVVVNDGMNKGEWLMLIWLDTNTI